MLALWNIVVFVDRGFRYEIQEGPGGQDLGRKLIQHAAKNVSNLITTIVNNTNIDSIHIIGDLSYADGHTQIWNTYMDMIEPFASRVPTMVAVGNHEYDYDTLGDGSKDASGVNTSNVFHPSWGGKAFHDEGGECGVSIAKRFAAPNNGNKIFW